MAEIKPTLEQVKRLRKIVFDSIVEDYPKGMTPYEMSMLTESRLQTILSFTGYVEPPPITTNVLTVKK